MDIEPRVGRLEDDVRELRRDVHGELRTISTTLERNTTTLEEHVRRTNLLETKVEKIEKPVLVLLAVLSILTTAAPWILRLIDWVAGRR